MRVKIKVKVRKMSSGNYRAELLYAVGKTKYSDYQSILNPNTEDRVKIEAAYITRMLEPSYTNNQYSDLVMYDFAKTENVSSLDKKKDYCICVVGLKPTSISKLLDFFEMMTSVISETNGSIEVEYNNNTWSYDYAIIFEEKTENRYPQNDKGLIESLIK